jgi:hypothetical protein
MTIRTDPNEGLRKVYGNNDLAGVRIPCQASQVPFRDIQVRKFRDISRAIHTEDRVIPM